MIGGGVTMAIAEIGRQAVAADLAGQGDGDCGSGILAASRQPLSGREGE